MSAPSNSSAVSLAVCNLGRGMNEQFGKMVYSRMNDCVTIRGKHTGDKVQGDMGPGSMNRNRQRFEEPRGSPFAETTRASLTAHDWQCRSTSPLKAPSLDRHHMKGIFWEVKALRRPATEL